MGGGAENVLQIMSLDAYASETNKAYTILHLGAKRLMRFDYQKHGGLNSVCLLCSCNSHLNN